MGGRPPSFSTRSLVPAKMPFWWSIATSLRCWNRKEFSRPAFFPLACRARLNSSKSTCLYWTSLPRTRLRTCAVSSVRVFDRAEERVDLPLVGSGVLEDAGDDAALVLGRDRGVLAGAERHVEQPGLDHRGEVEQPLGEVGRPDVGDRQPRPVEDPLGEPVIGRGVALGVLPGGLLRHVHDAVDAGLLRGLGEIRRRLQDAGADGVDEVGPLHAAQRGRTWPKSSRSP